MTTTATTQMGQGATEVSHIDGWDIPLMPKRRQKPSKSTGSSRLGILHQSEMMKRQATKGSRRAAGTTATTTELGLAVPPPVGRDGYSSAAGSAPPPKAPPSKARPSTPPTRKDWVIPSGTKRVSFSGHPQCPIKGNSEFITSAWMDERDHFLLSIVQGPRSSSCQYIGIQHLGHSILRRVTAIRLHGLRSLQSGGS